jgi:hypothetical protein
MCCSSHQVRPSSFDTQPSHSNDSSVMLEKFQRIGRPSVWVPSCRMPSRWCALATSVQKSPAAAPNQLTRQPPSAGS